MLWIVTQGTLLIFNAGWFSVVIRADLWLCGLVVFKVFDKTWQTISAASQYEIWILVSSASWDQRDNWNLLCNEVMTVNAVTLYMISRHTGTNTYIHKLWYVVKLIILTLSPWRVLPFFICCCSNVTIWLTHVSYHMAAHRSGLPAFQLGRSLWAGWDGEGAARVSPPAPLQRPHASRCFQAQTAGDEDRCCRQTPQPSPRQRPQQRQRQWWVRRVTALSACTRHSLWRITMCETINNSVWK